MRGAALATAALALAGCASSGAATQRSIETATFAPTLGIDLSAMTRLSRDLYIRDVTVGTGTVAGTGSQVSVRYTGWLADGTQVESNTAPTEAPIGFQLGKGEVIGGWDRGIRGMRVGGRRQLVIAPSLGYGGRERPGIPPHSILVFEVDLTRVR